MRNTGVSSNIKKILSLLVVLCMLVALVPATTVSANSADLKSAVEQLNKLETNQKASIVNAMWSFIVTNINDGKEIQVVDILDAIKSTTAGELITETAEPGDGKISNQSVIILIEKLLAHKETLVDLYNDFKGKGILSALMTFTGTTTEGDTFVKLLEKFKSSSTKLVTMNGDQFVKNTSGEPADLIILSLTGFDLSGITGIDIAAYKDRINNAYNRYVDSLNNQNPLTKEETIYILNDILGIYKAPVAPTPTPSTDTGGGVVIVPTATPTPAPTATPNPIIPGGAEEVQNIKDPAAALDKAVELISKAANLINNAETSAKSTNDISQAMLQIAQAALEKVNTQTITSVTTAGEAKAVLSESDAAKLSDSIDKILETAKKLTDTLKSAGADTKVEAVLNIKATTDATANKVAVEIPSSLLAKAVEKKLDKVVIDTGVAKMVLAPDAVTVTGNKAVVFTATKLDNAKLPEDVKKITGDNAVYDYKLLVGDEKVTNFNKPIEIQIPYSLKAGENANKITVFYIDDAGKVQNVVGTYDSASGTVKFKTNHFSYYVVKINNVTFKDINSVEWARENIETMASKGVIGGIGNDMYAPEASITRAEFAAMMVRAFKLQDSTAKNTFKDINDSDWFASEVAAAVKAGLVTGNGDGTFTPDANITREDMAVIMARALTSVKAKDTTKTITSYIEKFTDKANISDYAKDAVALTVKYEIVKGMTTDTFVPANEATRAEAAAMMYRIFFLK